MTIKFRNWGRTLPALMIVSFFRIVANPEYGRTPVVAGADDYRITVNVGLVVLPVVVTNRQGRAVAGLGQNSFHVFDDGRPQQISLFQAEDVPITVGLVVDNSGSMRGKRDEVIAAAEEFAKSSDAQDQMFVLNFNDSVSLGLPPAVPFTSDMHQLLEALSQRPAVGNTALYDGLAAALNHVELGTATRKALIVVSDGGDNASHISFQQVLQRAQSANVQIYTLGVYDVAYRGEDLNVLKRLAKVSGGKSYFPQSPSQITGICQQIAAELRQQYTLGYHPSDSAVAGSYHAIRVTATDPQNGKLHVSTRAGYVLPSNWQAAPEKASL